VMRVLGARRRLLAQVFMLRLVLFGLAASLVGCLVGWAGQFALAATLADWFGGELPLFTLVLTGTLMTFFSVTVRHFFVDWVDQARNQRLSAARGGAA